LYPKNLKAGKPFCKKVIQPILTRFKNLSGKLLLGRKVLNTELASPVA
jgi:hypothetical protein